MQAAGEVAAAPARILTIRVAAAVPAQPLPTEVLRL